MNNLDLIKKRFEASIALKEQVLKNDVILKLIDKAATVIIESIKKGATIYFAGNGGSAADAQHLAAELSGRFYLDRKPLSADALHCNTSFLTAVANDYSYDMVYARLLAGIGRRGDILVGLSTSGNSANIVRAFEQACSMGITTISMTGEGGGMMKELSDIAICVPSMDTPRIQETHILIGHTICEIIESTLFQDQARGKL